MCPLVVDEGTLGSVLVCFYFELCESLLLVVDIYYDVGCLFSARLAYIGLLWGYSWIGWALGSSLVYDQGFVYQM